MTDPREITRRALLGGTAGALFAAPGKRTAGLALYTVRQELERDPAQVLRTAASIGYREAEVMRSHLANIVPMLRAHGMEPVSVHFETPIITGNWQGWKDAEMPAVDERLTFDDVLDASGKAGVRNIVFNYLPPQERGELDYYRGLSDKLNAAAEKCQRAGARLWYHNHNFEFQQKTGGRPIDVLLDRLNPKQIDFEVDAFWVSMAGVNPAEWIRKLNGRAAAVHLKDRARGAVVPKFDIASVPHSTFVEVGTGDLNLRQILHACANAGVRHYFVEQDHSSSPLTSIRSSFEALRKLGF